MIASYVTSNNSLRSDYYESSEFLTATHRCHRRRLSRLPDGIITFMMLLFRGCGSHDVIIVITVGWLEYVRRKILHRKLKSKIKSSDSIEDLPERVDIILSS